MKIAFLGLGAMGSRMAKRLLNAGHRLSVWNRSEAAAIPLVNQGARIASTPADAVRDADLVFSMVRDDKVSQLIWCDPQTGALAAMKPGSTAVECSTLSLEWVNQLASRMQQQQIAFVEAPVSGSRPAAEHGQLIFFAAGEQSVIERLKPVLLLLGSQVNSVGPIGCGAATKLFTNAMLGTQVALFAELLGICNAKGLPASAILKAMASTPVWAPVANYLTMSMLAHEHSPQFPIELVEKDLQYALDLSVLRLPVIETVLGVFTQGSQQGLGFENMTAVAKLY